LKLFIQVFLQSLSERSLLGSFFYEEIYRRTAISIPATKTIGVKRHRKEKYLCKITSWKEG
jgi:hypothetical protein